MLKCKISNLVPTIWPLVRADVPVFIHGKTGIGKSEIVNRELMDRMRHEYGPTVLHDFRLSSKDTVDGTGMPDIDKVERATYWTRPAFIPKDDGKMHLVFLDEVGHASIQMQHVAYQLVRERRLGDFQLPKQNRIVLALNVREDKGGDNKLVKPFEARGAHVTVDLDVNGWAEEMKRRNIDARLIAFIKFRPELLHKLDENNPAFPTPRTIEFVGRVMQHETDVRVIQACASAACGEGFSMQFATFLKDLGANIPRLDQIKKDPKGCKVPTDPHHQFVVASAISETMTDKDADIWAIYLARKEFAADLASMAAHNATKRLPELSSVKSLQNLILD
jgi:hypothetical protein